MADIFLARRAGSAFAVKILNSRRAHDDEARALFHDEARLLRMLNHGNITSAHEVDVIDGVYYLAMEYVHGVDLRELLAAAMLKKTAVDFAAAMSIVAAAAAGLDHAHRRCSPEGRPLRLVHRDVSLSNIMVTYGGHVKVVDFGIASTTLSSVDTIPGTVRGKASYMSPEQCLGDPLDHRTDVFALGVVLYELTTGERCFHGKTDFERMLAVTRGDYVRPSSLVADYPPELEQVVCTALAIDANHRFASAAALMEALEHVAIGRGWALGTKAIVRMMDEVYDDIDDPTAIPVSTDMIIEAQAPLQEPEAPITTVPEQPAVERTAVLTQMPRLARGTQQDLLGGEPWKKLDDDEQPTRGRRSLPRIPLS